MERCRTSKTAAGVRGRIGGVSHRPASRAAVRPPARDARRATRTPSPSSARPWPPSPMPRPCQSTTTPVTEGPIAGAAVGVGAAEAARRELSPDEVREAPRRELHGGTRCGRGRSEAERAGAHASAAAESEAGGLGDPTASAGCRTVRSAAVLDVPMRPAMTAKSVHSSGSICARTWSLRTRSDLCAQSSG